MTRAPLLVVIAAGALALGCGAGDDPPTASAATDKALDGALQFARCMRENGVDVPDPKLSSDGGMVFRVRGPGRARQPGDPKFDAADKACERHLSALKELREERAR